MLGVIKTEITRIGRVLENFRDFASISQLNLAPVNLAELIDRQVQLIKPQAEQQQIQIKAVLPEEQLPDLVADRVRLEQVLLNLLVNAMQAMPTGGHLTIRVSRLAPAERESLKVEVIDTGTGIPANLSRLIFDPYFTTKSDGTGMGLALCDKIIRQHEGSLDYHESAHGTVFEIVLPSEPAAVL